MKIAFFENGIIGGAWQAAFEQVKRLSAHHIIDHYTITQATAAQWGEESGIRKTYTYQITPKPPYCRIVERLIPYFRLCGFRVPLRFYNFSTGVDEVSREMAKDIAKSCYDVAFCHQSEVEHIPYVLRYLEIPSVFYCQEPTRWIHDPFRTSEYSYGDKKDHSNFRMALYVELNKERERNDIRKCNIVLTNSYYMREAIFRSYGVFARVNYLGVDTKLFRPLGLMRENMVLVIGGGRHKGADLVIESIGKLPKNLRPIITIILSYRAKVKKEEKFLQQLAQHHDVEVSCLEGIQKQTLIELYNRAKMVVCGYLMEPFGLVALEAMACGTPVIASKEGGLRESIIDGQTGLLVERETQSLDNAIGELQTNDTLWKRLSTDARDYVCSNWTWERSIKELEGYLEEAISQRKIKRGGKGTKIDSSSDDALLKISSNLAFVNL